MDRSADGERTQETKLKISEEDVGTGLTQWQQRIVPEQPRLENTSSYLCAISLVREIDRWLRTAGGGDKIGNNSKASHDGVENW